MHGKEDYYSKTGIFKPYYNIQIGASDEYILHYGVYPRIIQIYQHSDWKESYKEAKTPKSISRNVALLDMQATAQENLKSEEGIFLRVRRSIEVEGAFG